MMRTDYAEVFQDARAAEKYDEVQYAADSQASAAGARQRRYLRRLVQDAFPLQSPTQHDFACGTGRAIGLLQGLVRGAHGYDSSAAMIERAQRSWSPAQWHLVDEDGPVPAPARSSGPSVVTAFRLLLNAPEEVRDRAVAFAAAALPTYTAGLLVLHNHGSSRSLRHLGARRNAGNSWFAELGDAEVNDLLDRHGFTLVGRRGCALFPAGWYRLRLTRPIVRWLDDLLCAVRVFDRYAVDVLYIARRDRPTAPPHWVHA
jgi:hypothetical protein